MKFLPWIFAALLAGVAARQIAATPTERVRLAQAPFPQSSGIIGPKFAAPQLAPSVPVSYAQPFKIDFNGDISRFNREMNWNGKEAELELVLRSWQNSTPLDKPSYSGSADIRFAEMNVTVRDAKTTAPMRDLPMRWKASGGIYREAVFIPSSGKNPPISEVNTNEYGFAPGQWVPTKAGLYQLWIEILKPDGSVFQRSKKIPIHVRFASWEAQVKTGPWSEARGQTDVYQRPVYLAWQLDDPAEFRRLENVALAPAIQLPDGTPVAANLSWFEQKTAPSLSAPGAGKNDSSLAPNATQFVRYDPLHAPARDLDAFLVSARLAAPPSPQLQQRMKAEEVRETKR